MDPERPIEKLLKALALKRRDDAKAPFELHPATRRLLHGEIAGRTPRRTRESFFSKLFSNRSGLAFAATVVVLIGIGAWIFAPILNPPLAGVPQSTIVKLNEPPTSKVTELAKSSTSPETPMSSPVSSESRSDKNLRQSLEKEGDADYLKVAKATPTPASAPIGGGWDLRSNSPITVQSIVARDELAFKHSASNGSGTYGDIIAATNVTLSLDLALATGRDATAEGLKDVPAQAQSQLALSDTAAPAAVAPKAPVPTGGRLQEDQTDSRSFYAIEATSSTQSWTRADTATTGARGAIDRSSGVLLTSFQVEQSGTEIRILDADGSIYQGWTARTEPVTAGEMPPARKLESGGIGGGGGGAVANSEIQSKESSPVPEYSFSVVGTNSSLRQRVTFTGRFLSITNQGAFTQSYGGSTLSSATTRTPARALPVIAVPARIIGTAVLDNSNRIEINAIPAPQN